MAGGVVGVDRVAGGEDVTITRHGRPVAHLVPAIWQLEIVNVLLAAQRRSRLTEADSSRFLELLLQLPIDVDDSPVDPARLLVTGQSHGLSSYDAAYLLLAERMGAPLATLNQQLADAASRAGVELIV